MAKFRTHMSVGEIHPFTQTCFHLPMCLSERRLLLVAIDLVALNGALVVASFLRPEYRLGASWVVKHPLWFLLLSLLWLLWASSFDAYDLRVAGKFITSARAVLLAALVTSGFYLLILYVTSPTSASYSLFFVFPLFTVILLLAGRGVYGLLLSQSTFHRRVLIVGAGGAGCAIAKTLLSQGDGTYQVLGFVDGNPAKQREVVHQRLVLGDWQALRELIQQYHVDTLVLAITHEVNGMLIQALTDCLEMGVEIIPMPVLYERLTGRVLLEHVGSNWYMVIPVDHPLTRPFNRLVKRVFDLIVASVGLLFLAPVFPFIALAIYLDSPGPIFYTQERVGQGGRVFRIYKFRSMVPDAEKGQAVWADKNDPRVTRVGRILRKTHIDEFPQLINILKGEMSAVGPRPERPEFVEKLACEIPFFQVRHAVKPGMAGWGLVKHGYASSKEDSMIKLQYDLYYIKHWSLWLDLVILLKTVLNTLTFKGQ